MRSGMVTWPCLHSHLRRKPQSQLVQGTARSESLLTPVWLYSRSFCLRSCWFLTCGSFPLTLQAPEFPLIWTLPSFLPSGLGLDILWVLIKQCVFWMCPSPPRHSRVKWSSCVLKLCISLVLRTLPHNLMFWNSLPCEAPGPLRSGFYLSYSLTDLQCEV